MLDGWAAIQPGWNFDRKLNMDKWNVLHRGGKNDLQQDRLEPYCLGSRSAEKGQRLYANSKLLRDGSAWQQRGSTGSRAIRRVSQRM